jgi:hypothetical protein
MTDKATMLHQVSETFPETCPWGLDQLLGEDFWPEDDATSRR